MAVSITAPFEPAETGDLIDLVADRPLRRGARRGFEKHQPQPSQDSSQFARKGSELQGAPTTQVAWGVSLRAGKRLRGRRFQYLASHPTNVRPLSNLLFPG